MLAWALMCMCLCFVSLVRRRYSSHEQIFWGLAGVQQQCTKTRSHHQKKDEIIKITWAWHGYEGNSVSSSEVAKNNVRLLELNPNPFVWFSLGTGYRHQPEPCRLVANAFPLCSNGFLRPRRGLAQRPALPWPPPPLWRLRPHLHPTLLGAQTSSSYPLLCLAAILISLLIKKNFYLAMMIHRHGGPSSTFYQQHRCQ